MTKQYVEISTRRLVLGLYVLAILAVGLGALGLHAAYQRVGAHSTAGRIISAAIVVEATATVLVLFAGRHLAKVRDRNQRCPYCGTTGSLPHEQNGEMCRLLQNERFWKNYEHQGASDE